MLEKIKTSNGLASWNDKMGSRDRMRKLLIIHTTSSGTDIKLFNGNSIEGVIAVLNSTYHKNGKWSYFEYDLVVNDETTCLVEARQNFNSPGHYFNSNTWDDLWIEFIKVCPQIIDLEFSVFKKFIKEYFNREYLHIEETEKYIKSLESISDEDIARALEVKKKGEEYLNKINSLPSIPVLLEELEEHVSAVERLIAEVDRVREGEIKNNPFEEFFNKE